MTELEEVFLVKKVFSAEHNLSKPTELGVSDTYDRKKYDAVYKRKQYTNQYFDGKKIKTDYISGASLHANRDAAKRKYGKIAAIRHVSDSDHIIPLKRVHMISKMNPFLSDQDVKDMANHTINYRITNSKLNRQKGDDSNTKIALDMKKEIPLAGRFKLLGDEVVASSGLIADGAVRTVKNMGMVGYQGAKTSLEHAAVPIMIESVRNLYEVSQGNKDIKTAAKDVGAFSLQIGVRGAGIEIVSTGLKNVAAKSSSQVLKNLNRSNIGVQIATTATVVAGSMIKYANGEIDEKQVFRSITDQGANLMMSYTISNIAGQILIPIPIVGAIVGSMILSTACNLLIGSVHGLYNSYVSMDSYKAKLDRVSAMEREALAEMERQRNLLKNMINEHFGQWDKEVVEGFQQISCGANMDDVEVIAGGLDQILNLIGSNVKFKTLKEFDDFLLDDHAILDL